jgi:hypothetical protein
VDTTPLRPAERRAVREILADLTRGEQGPWGRVDGHVGLAGATEPLRDPLALDRGIPPRRPGAARGYVSGGLGVTLLFGPVALVTHPYFDTRLKYDPEYFGKKDHIIAGRNAEAYVRASWRYGEVFFGTMDRNWGPPAVEGLLVSPSPYGYDHFGIAIGTSGLRLEGLLTQLDDATDSLGVPVHRYFVAHRLIIHPPGPTTVALWEGNLLAGRARQLEPWYANILNLGLLVEYDQGNGAGTNSLLGLDITTRIGRVRPFGSLLLDDIQVDRRGGATSGNNEPSSYGLTLGAQGGLGPASWTAFYTRVANLTYRTSNPAEAVMRRGLGLGRDFSDYDQLTLKAGVAAGPGVLLTPEATLLRQGQGDFRLPYPPVTAYDTTPGFLAGIVQRTVRLAVDARLERPRWSLVADGGAHLIHNAGHVAGATRTRWVGSIALTYRFHKESVLP